MRFKKTFRLSIFLTGLTSVTAQVIFVRELLVVFSGNELSIGIIFASWLLWGAFGSYISSLVAKNIKSKKEMYAAGLAGVAFSLPLTLFFLRFSRAFLGVNIGEMVGFVPMTLVSFTALSVPCFLMGFLFSLACRVYREIDEDLARITAKVYSLEAIGALSGGVLISWFFIRFFSSTHIIIALTVLNLLFSYLIIKDAVIGKSAALLKRISYSIFVLVSVLLAVTGGKLFDEVSLKALWKGFDVIERKDSIYGNIVLIKKKDQYSLYGNGLHLYTDPDALSSEKTAHFALLETENPRKILLIGGGAGIIREILKHPAEKIDYLEIDPEIIEINKKHFFNGREPENGKINVINQDARFFVKNASGRYDSVIISLGDPYTAQINRFYTVDFFKELKRLLSPRGVISFSVTSSENYIGEDLEKYLRSLYKSAARVFPGVLVFPGDTAYFFASKSEGVLTDDCAVLGKRLKERGIRANFINEYYLKETLSRERMDYINDIVSDEGGEIDVNSDFKPVSYYYATLFWSTQFDEAFFHGILSSIRKEHIWLFLVIMCLGILMFCRLRQGGSSKRGVLTAVMTTGFSEIIFQIIVILSFQVIFGYVFYKIGIMIAAFMGGLVIGNMIIARYAKPALTYRRIFILTQLGICFYPLMLPLIFSYFSRPDTGIFSSWLGANIIFPFMPVIAGIMGGIQFPVANRIILDERERKLDVAGLTYGVDLAGSGIGALLASAVLIPILGVFGVCYLTAVINFTVLAALML